MVENRINPFASGERLQVSVDHGTEWPRTTEMLITDVESMKRLSCTPS
jgi:hypothetical protein